MKTNQAGIDLIKRFEGLRLEAYKCPAGVWTIGYGTTRGVYDGMRITQAIAEKLLMEDITLIEDRLNGLKIALNDNQFSALVCLVYNIGFGALLNSKMLAMIRKNASNPAIKSEWDWNKVDGVILPGLVRRREAECHLFFT